MACTLMMMGRDIPLLLEGCWVGLGALCAEVSFLRGGGGTSSTLLDTVAASLCLFFRDFLAELGGACISGAADPVDGPMAEFSTDTDVFVAATDTLRMDPVGGMTGEVDVATGVWMVPTSDMTGDVDVAIGTGV